jgi:hypothetical protein
VKRNYLIGVAIAAVILSLFVLIFNFFFEIRAVTKYSPPSREVRVNEYLALDRWLTGMGIPVRVETSGDFFMLSQAKEKNIFIQASLFDWTDEAVSYLASWVEKGGTLLLVLDYPVWWQDEEPIVLLDKFGIRAEEILPSRNNAVEARNGVTRSEQVKRGRGKIVALQDSNFMRSINLDDESNIRLAWALFASDPKPDNAESGWLFIRGKAKVRGLLGTIFQQGNFAVLLVAVLVLLVVCFWAVIPGFGLVKWDNEKSSRPLRERFLAEGRFLKRYGALDFYSQAYVREIKRQLAMREGIMVDEESMNRALEIYEGLQNKPEDEKGSNLLVKAFRKEPFTFREFPDLINAFRTVLKFFGNFSF